MAEINGLNLKTLDASRGSSSNYEQAVSILAVLKIHGELPKNDEGIASITIRELIRRCAPAINPVLREYVCAFGAHGIPVMERYVLRYADVLKSEEDLRQDVEKRYSAFKQTLA